LVLPLLCLFYSLLPARPSPTYLRVLVSPFFLVL